MAHGSRPRVLLRSCAPARLCLLGLAWLAALLVSCGNHDASGPPCSSPSCIEVRLDKSLDPLERSAARFEHANHVKALGSDSCATCHPSSKDGDFGLRDVATATSRSDRIDRYHAACIGCHQQRHAGGQKSGPELCGECHRGTAVAAPAMAPVAMNLSLHQRHAVAHQNKCDTCHHAFDESAGKLVYRKGEENACRDCHAAADDGKKLSWRHAAHASCVGCHATTATAGSKTGPTDCSGCHDPAVLGSVQRLDPVPRLDRGQAAWVWMRAPWATTATVVFPHEQHESTTDACSSCHHKTLRRCEECHSDEGKPEGGNVTLEAAFHNRASQRSCVGCHERLAASNKQCAGCHDSTARTGTATPCDTCHNGGDHARAAAPTNPHQAPATLDALPGSPELPDKDLLVKEQARLYQGAKLPHPRIVARLDKAVRASPLAARFHGSTATLCSGCHHHQAQVAKASRCTSCHGDDDAASRDRPSATQAYHRQCIGCHERMDIQAVGCTDCHAKAEASK